MSYTQIFVVRENGDVDDYVRIGNAGRGALNIWMKLREVYEVQEDSPISFNKTWKLYNSGTLEDFEDITLGTTFDRVVVRKKNLLTVASSFDKFFQKYQETSSQEQADVLRRMNEQEKDCLGVCWNQTSVNADVWNYSPSCEHEEERPYNIYKDGSFWFLFQDSKDGETPALDQPQ
ncbi:hypothetical protein GOV12_07600 [Candidatus Pacearchaeota archaeon]|nr:hypothetical protein [Candidatus Pacearchaeota archaeon]